MATTASAVARAQNRAIAKGTDPKAATCRAKLQRARSALNRQMDRELRLREGAENLLRATAKSDHGDNGGVGSGCRNKSKSRKLIRQTVALELSFLESNVRVLADELAELNGSVDVYQYRDDDDDDDDLHGFGHGSITSGTDGGKRRRQRQMPMIAVPLKDTRPIDFGPPLERFIEQHYGVDVSAAPDECDGSFSDDGRRSSGGVRRRPMTLREAIDELTQLRQDTQTPSRDVDGVRLLLRYYRQLYYVDRRFFPPPSAVVSSVSTTPRPHHPNGHHHQPSQDHHHRHSKHAATTDSSPSLLFSQPPAIYFEWYDSFGGPVPSCGQRTVRFEQACVLFNVAAVHTQMGAKHDRRARDEDSDAAGRPSGPPSSSTDGRSGAMDGATAAVQCFLRAAGAYRHIGDTFANAPARAADLRATGVLYTMMMAQAYECVFEKLQWRLMANVRHRCRWYRGDINRSGGSFPSETFAEGPDGDRYGRGDRDAKTRRTSAISGGSGSGSGINDVNLYTPSWTEMAREAAHVSRMYAEVVYNSCRPNEGTGQGAGGSGKENELPTSGVGTPSSALPEVWVSVCRIKDRHYAALAYRYAACALLPYFRCSADVFADRHHRGHRRSPDETDADELLSELTAAAAAAGLDVAVDDDDDDKTSSSSAVAQQLQRCKQIGKLLLEAAAATHDRAARAQRLCRQLRSKSDGNSSGGSGGGGGGLLAGVLDRERQRTVRLLLSHRRNDDDNDDYGTKSGGVDADDDDDDDEDQRCCCGAGNATKGRREQRSHECYSDDEAERTDAAAVADHCVGGSGDQDEFAGIPGLDVDRGVLVRPRTRFRLQAIAPDFTDTGDGDNDVDDDDDDDTDKRQRQRRPREATDCEERRADLFAGLGPVAVFSARLRCTRPRWAKVIRNGRHRPDGDDDEPTPATLDPIQFVDRWFGFELRSHGGGAAGAVPPATIGHVRSNSLAQHAGLRRGDIVVALKFSGDNLVMDVRWETCRRVAELVVHGCQRRRRLGSGVDGVAVQLRVVTPITSDGYAATMAAAAGVTDPAKMFSRRRIATSMTLPLPPPMPQMLPQSASKQRRQRRQNTNSGSDATNATNKTKTWLWNPFRRRRRTVVGNKC